MKIQRWLLTSRTQADSDLMNSTCGSTSSLAYDIRCSPLWTYDIRCSPLWTYHGHWSYLWSDQCSDSVWGVAVRCGLLCILTGVTGDVSWCILTDVSWLVSLTDVWFTGARLTWSIWSVCVPLALGWSLAIHAGVVVCAGELQPMNCSTLHVSTQWLCYKPSSLENPLGCRWRINIDWLIELER